MGGGKEMSKKVYDIKTGKDYEYIETYTDEVVARGEDGNKVIINNSDVVYEDEVENFKKIFKLLCKRGDIKLKNEKYSEYGQTYWSDGVGSTPKYDYLETTLKLDGKVLLSDKCKLNK
jgi:hypothetical protein